MKVYSVTQVSDEGEWTGTSVHSTPEYAVASVNENIDEHNEFIEEDEVKINRILWPERRGSWTYVLGFYKYYFQVHDLS